MGKAASMPIDRLAFTKKYVGWRACHSQCHGNPHGLAGSAVVRDQSRVRLSTYFLVSAANTLPHEIANTEIWPKKNGEITGSAISNRAIAACKLAIELDTSVIAITGDVTDTGAEEEWKQFAKVLAKAFQSQS